MYVFVCNILVSNAIRPMMQYHTCHTYLSYFIGVDHDAVLQAAVDDPALHQSDGQVQCEAAEHTVSAYKCLLGNILMAPTDIYRYTGIRYRSVKCFLFFHPPPPPTLIIRPRYP